MALDNICQRHIEEKYIKPILDLYNLTPDDACDDDTIHILLTTQRRYSPKKNITRTSAIGSVWFN